jgi:hypothetical protein
VKPSSVKEWFKKQFESHGGKWSIPAIIAILGAIGVGVYRYLSDDKNSRPPTAQAEPAAATTKIKDEEKNLPKVDKRSNPILPRPKFDNKGKIVKATPAELDQYPWMHIDNIVKKLTRPNPAEIACETLGEINAKTDARGGLEGVYKDRTTGKFKGGRLPDWQKEIKKETRDMQAKKDGEFCKTPPQPGTWDDFHEVLAYNTPQEAFARALANFSPKGDAVAVAALPKAGEPRRLYMQVPGKCSDYDINVRSPGTAGAEGEIKKQTLDDKTRDSSGVCVIKDPGRGASHIYFNSKQNGEAKYTFDLTQGPLANREQALNIVQRALASPTPAAPPAKAPASSPARTSPPKATPPSPPT